MIKRVDDIANFIFNIQYYDDNDYNNNNKNNTITFAASANTTAYITISFEM